MKRNNIQYRICVRAQPNKLDKLLLSSFIFQCIEFWWIIDVLRENAQFALHMRGALYNNEKLMSRRWRSRRRSGRKMTQQGDSFCNPGSLGIDPWNFFWGWRACVQRTSAKWRVDKGKFLQFSGLEWKVSSIKIVFSKLHLIGGWRNALL